MELVCIPMRMVKASQAEIVERVMTSIDKMKKEMSSSPQEEDNGEWEVQKKKRRGGAKTRYWCIWNSRKTIK